jgi:hypothetical protein
VRHPQTLADSTPFARLPRPLRAALIELLGEDAQSVDLIERSWRVRWHPRALATTRRNRIYLRGSIEDFARNAEVVLHEYFHVLEQWRPRRLTRTRYIWEWLRRGYWHNRFEVEAREYVAQNLRHFRRLIARAEPPPANPGSLRADTGGPRAT